MQPNKHPFPPTVTPLETLVVQQIAEMLREERTLAQRYRQLGSSGRLTADMNVFSDELSRFGQRANRLYRLIEAMEGCCSTRAVEQFA
jgi:hypothetical protein